MDAPTTEAGRKPRVAGERESQILDGVIQTLTDVGYDRLTFDAVAAQVRASKATLYRKWPTKAELVLAAVEYVKDWTHQDEELRDTGSLTGDLDAMFCQNAESTDAVSEMFRAVVPAMHRDPDFGGLFVERFIKPRMTEVREVLERAQGRGEIGAGADLDQLASVVPAAVIFRLMVTDQPAELCFMQSIIQDVLLPACRASTEPSA